MEEWEKYRDRYASRPETFDAYVDVWRHVPGARQAFTGWTSFSQAANAEPAQRRDRVRVAEDLMRSGGYEIGPPAPRGGRRWFRSVTPEHSDAGEADLSHLPAGVREVRIVRQDGSERTETDLRSVRVVFGPHHVVHVELEDERTMFAVVATHHGVRLDASTPGGELEQAIEHLRQRWPDKAID